MTRKSKVSVARQSIQVRGRSVRNFRMRILGAFRTLGHGVDARTARLKMFAFYRSSGASWARYLA